jgi:hypothetical protein
MKNLYDQLLMRFPEIESDLREAGDDAPYLVVGYLVDWLDAKGQNGIDEGTIQRLVEFVRWCESQPRGETCSDDIWTFLVVAFYENLFHHEHTKWLIPRLLSKKDVEQNKDYFITWVGKENYEEAMKHFEEYQGR